MNELHKWSSKQKKHGSRGGERTQPKKIPEASDAPCPHPFLQLYLPPLKLSHPVLLIIHNPAQESPLPGSPPVYSSLGDPCGP